MERLDLAWLTYLCDPLRREKIKLGIGIFTNDEDAVLVAEPMSLFVEGQPWAFASNGHAIAFVRAESSLREATQKQNDTIRGLLIHEVAGRTLKFKEVTTWAGRGWAQPIPCHACGGQWAKVCTKCWGQGEVKGECPRCSHQHDCNCVAGCDEGVLYCERCVGGKRIAIAQGRIGGGVYNRNLIGRFLSKVPAKAQDDVVVDSRGATHPLYITAADGAWRVVVMPLRDDIPSKECPEL